MRKLIVVALALIAMAQPVQAAELPEHYNLMARSWSCDVHELTFSIDAKAAPSAWHVEQVKWAIVSFAVASGWKVRLVPKGALVQIRWNPLYGAWGQTWGFEDSGLITAAAVDLDPIVPRPWFFAAVLHELGHVGGLDHVRPHWDAIMSPELGFSAEVLVAYGDWDKRGLVLAHKRCVPVPTPSA